METDDRLHVKIFDPQNSRYEVPESVIPRPTITSSAEKTANYRFGYTANPFGFHISRVNTGEVIFNTSTSLFNPQFKGLVFEDQYLEVFFLFHFTFFILFFSFNCFFFYFNFLYLFFQKISDLNSTSK